jgi:RNA polymerase sigma-70 factor (ECF subfamily)
MNPETFIQQPGTAFQKELIKACKNGDPRAQLQVYKLYFKPVYNICLLIVPDSEKAEALMHESFLAAFENIGSYSEQVSFPRWLLNFIKYDSSNEK